VTRLLRMDWGAIPAVSSAATASTPDRRQPIRILAVSDDMDAALDHRQNRERLGRVDLICGCGDLSADYLAFLADAFVAPLVYVRGNHDTGLAWDSWRDRLPEPLPDGRVEAHCGVDILGVSWPVRGAGSTFERESAAWRQVLRAGLRPRGGVPSDLLVLSHVPPRDLGDVSSDPFHRGFGAYRWLADRVQPRLWLHGHTPVAAGNPFRLRCGATEIVNVTGSLLLELRPAVEPLPAMARSTTLLAAAPVAVREVDRERAQP